VRVAVVAETFHPNINGVSNSVSRVLSHLASTGHEAVVVAPGQHRARGPWRGAPAAGVGPPEQRLGGERHCGFPVQRVRSFRPPMYPDLRLGRPGVDLRPVLSRFAPDVVHLASPVLLGYAGAVAARDLGIPAVAVFQTDLAGFVSRYHLAPARPLVWRHLRRVHGLAALTLVPSTTAGWRLRAQGIGPIDRWARGVDLDAFHPRHRSEAFRSALAPRGEVLVGYLGRLAREKRLHLLAPLTAIPNVRVVLIGGGPARAALERRMPAAAFLGERHGAELSAALASLDIFVHPGRNETFCQAMQEALAAGVPVVAAAHGGPLDLVRHGENGWLWGGDDPGLLREQVATLAADPAMRQAMGRRARDSVLDRTWASLGDQLLAHYRSVLPAPAATKASGSRTAVAR
jgi:phosphatidylinositol alpha 1,6-mannosyltransferase